MSLIITPEEDDYYLSPSIYGLKVKGTEWMTLAQKIELHRRQNPRRLHTDEEMPISVGVREILASADSQFTPIVFVGAGIGEGDIREIMRRHPNNRVVIRVESRTGPVRFLMSEPNAFERLNTFLLNNAREINDNAHDPEEEDEGLILPPNVDITIHLYDLLDVRAFRLLGTYSHLRGIDDILNHISDVRNSRYGITLTDEMRNISSTMIRIDDEIVENIDEWLQTLFQ